MVQDTQDCVERENKSVNATKPCLLQITLAKTWE